MTPGLVCCFGEILWDLLPTGKMPGGAPMNVGIHLKNLGIDVACITRVGDDELGTDLRQFLRDKGCTDAFVQVDPAHATGTVKVNVTDKTNVQYEIVHPAAWDFISATGAALDISRDAFAFVFGTLACRDEVSRNSLLQLLETSHATKIFDVNLRAPFYSKELIFSLLPKAHVVKMNEDELGIVHQWLGGTATFQQKIESIRTRFGIKTVIVTRGGAGAVMVDDTGSYSSKVYKVEVKDTIGSGDSFLAGMIKNFAQQNPPEKALNYACALGALVAQHHGANPPIKESEIFELVKKGS